MGEVRGKNTRRLGIAIDIVAHHAGLGGEESLTRLGLTAGNNGQRIGLLPLHPLRKLSGLDDFDAEKHVGVGVAAELGALAVVVTDFIALNPHVILAAWYEVDLTSDLRNPERVDDVLGAEIDVNCLALRNHEFIRHGTLGVIRESELRILEAEPPLLADDVDFKNLLLDDLGVILLCTFEAGIPSGELGRRDRFSRYIIIVPDRAKRRNCNDHQCPNGGGNQADFDERVAVAFFDARGILIARTGPEFNDRIN